MEAIQNNCQRECRKTPGCLVKMLTGEMSLKCNYLDTRTEDMFAVKQIEPASSTSENSPWVVLCISVLEGHLWKKKTKKTTKAPKRNRTLHSDNDPKHTSKSTDIWLQTMKWRVLEWLSQNLDLKIFEKQYNLWLSQKYVQMTCLA